MSFEAIVEGQVVLLCIDTSSEDSNDKPFVFCIQTSGLATAFSDMGLPSRADAPQRPRPRPRVL